MARLSHATASAYLRAALDDIDATVRQKAIMALSRLGARGLGRKLSGCREATRRRASGTRLLRR
jgi:hypothetical protein